MYFPSLLYNLLLVIEIYGSWITLTGPGSETENVSGEDGKATSWDSIHHEISTPTTQPTLNSEITNPADAYEPKNTSNKNGVRDKCRYCNKFHTRNRTHSAPTTTKTELTTLNPEIQNEISTEQTLKDTCHRDSRMLNQIDQLADKVETNELKENEDLIYSSHISNVQEDMADIIWQEKRFNGPEVMIPANAIHQLPINSTIKIFVFKDKHPSKFLSDVVVVKTKLIEETPAQSVLQVKFENKYLHYSHGSWKCVYWDYQNSMWKDTGVTTELESKLVICSSSHLSAFSILMDPYNILYNREYWHDSHHESWLTNISIIGSLITIAFLILVIIITSQKKIESETTKILINSSSALLLTHVSYQFYTFLSGFVDCLIISFMTHYFVLAFLLWTAADGINMWRILITDVFNTKGYVFYRWYKIISWGIPLITTTIGLIFTEPHSHRRGQLRFHRNVELIFYLVPCMSILCCNMLLFTWMFIKMTCKNRLGRMKDKKVDYILALTQVFGIGWCIVFPFLCFPSTHLLGEYLFAAVTSTQGLLIFIVRCGHSKNLKKKLEIGFHSTFSSSSVSTWFHRMSKSSTDHASTNKKGIDSN